MLKKILYCDVDNTLIASEKRLVDLYNQYYRKSDEKLLRYEDANTWDMGIPSNMVEEIFTRRDFYNSEIIWYDYAKLNLQKLRERGYKIIIYSKGTLGNISSKCDYLNSEIGGLIDGHVFIGSKNLEMGKYMLDMKDCIILDDHPRNLVGNNTAYNICAKLTDVEVEWNKDFKEDLSKGNLVMNSWNEIQNIITMIEMFDRF